MSSRAVTVSVTGRVQGVGFRFRTEEQARAHGVAGWVRNEPDGSVTAHLEGDADAVEAVVAWCRQGPSYAQVTHCDVVDAEVTGATGFEVRY